MHKLAKFDKILGTLAFALVLAFVCGGLWLAWPAIVR